MRNIAIALSVAVILVNISLTLAFADQTHIDASSLLITNAVPATSATGTIFENQKTLTYNSGRVILASNAEGTGRMLVDDVLTLTITRSDNTSVTYTHFYDANFAPVDLTAYFKPGDNLIRTKLENIAQVGESSALWLVNVSDTPVSFPFQITDQLPTLPYVASGSFFARYFFVDYFGSDRILLASNAQGTGLIQSDDVLRIQVIRPDGASRVFTGFKGFTSVADLTSYFGTGRNLVHVWLENTDLDGGSSALWLTSLPAVASPLPLQLAPSIPSIAANGRDFWGNYAYVDYSGTKSFWLSGDANNAIGFQVDGTLHLQVVHPDGDQQTYTRFPGTYGPIDVSSYFAVGRNLVHLRLEQNSGMAGTTPIFLKSADSAPPTVPAAVSGWQYKITDPVASGQGVFVDKTVEVVYQTGTVMLSAYADGTGQMSVDDYARVTITQNDGVTQQFTRTIGSFAPIELTPYLKVGTNQVNVRLVNTGGPGSASSFWLVNLPPTPVSFPVKLNDDISTNIADMLTRHLYVPYDGSSQVILAHFADGTGNMYIDDSVYLTFTRPDGTTATYSHGIGAFSPQDLAQYLHPGINRIQVRLVNTASGGSANALWLSTRPAVPQPLPIKLTDAVSSSQGEFVRSYAYVERFDNGIVTLSANSDGTGLMNIDDYIDIIVTHADQTQSQFRRTIGSFGPVDLSPYFTIGRNLVQLSARNTAGGGAVSSLWLSQTGNATSSHADLHYRTEPYTYIHGDSNSHSYYYTDAHAYGDANADSSSYLYTWNCSEN